MGIGRLGYQDNTYTSALRKSVSYIECMLAVDAFLHRLRALTSSIIVIKTYI